MHLINHQTQLVYEVLQDGHILSKRIFLMNVCGHMISYLKLIEIVILWVYYTIPFGFSLFRHFLIIIF